jgi:hypothetical protein
MASYYLLILVTVLGAAACGYMAKRRGASVRFWVFCGLLFGPFALPFVLFARPMKEKATD